MIDGMSATVTYKKADQLCPSGYEIIAQQGQTTALDYVMTIECNTAPPAPTTPAPIVRANDVDPAMFAAAQNIAASQYCSRDITSLFHEGAREMFEAAQCPDGHSIQIDCNAGQCRELH